MDWAEKIHCIGNKKEVKKVEIGVILPENIVVGNYESEKKMFSSIKEKLFGRVISEGQTLNLSLDWLEVRLKVDRGEPKTGIIGQKTNFSFYQILKGKGRDKDPNHEPLFNVFSAPDESLKKMWDSLVGIDLQKQLLLQHVKICFEQSQLESWAERYMKLDSTAREFFWLNLDLKGKILITGAPGTGKTYLAESFIHPLSEELGCTIDECEAITPKVLSKYVSESPKLISQLFGDVRKRAVDCPQVLFLDEFDAIARTRAEEQEHAEIKRATNQLLIELDHTNPTQNVFVVAATNFEQVLDPAVWRRFDMILHLDRPRREGRKQLLTKILEPCGIKDDAQIERMALLTRGFTPADIKKGVRIAVFQAAYNNSPVTEGEVLRALSTVRKTEVHEQVPKFIFANKGKKIAEVDSIEDLIRVVEKMSPEIIVQHIKRQDFIDWIGRKGDMKLAKEVMEITLQTDSTESKKNLIEMCKKYVEEV
jgi:MoxR-like ATPase